MKIRLLGEADFEPLLKLFHDTIRTINAQDYTLQQLQVWAPDLELHNKEEWKKSFREKTVFVAEEKEKQVGFAELKTDGQIDRFYIHKDFIGKGVGARLFKSLEGEACQRGIPFLLVESSLTAKPFFEKQGFETIRRQTVYRQGIGLDNYLMKKTIHSPQYIPGLRKN